MPRLIQIVGQLRVGLSWHDGNHYHRTYDNEHRYEEYIACFYVFIVHKYVC